MINNTYTRSFLSLIFCLMTNVSLAANSAPKVGRAAAAKYFQKNPDQTPTRSMASEENSSTGDRYLSFGLSTYTKSESYSWGPTNKETDIGKFGVDLNYRVSQYNSLLDYSLRVNYSEYEPNNEKAKKLSFLAAISLPDAGSRFPLYFGAAAGGGVFLTQIKDESPVTIDYQLFMGLRLFDIFEKTGFYVEGGLRNHLQLTTDGQFNGTYVSTGAVFTF